MAHCSVSVTSNNYFVLTGHKTHDGLGILAAPFFKNELGSSPAEVGESIVAALGCSRTEFDESNRDANAILEFTGYRTWKAFERDSINFSVRSNDHDGVMIIPSDPAPKGGFLHKQEQARSCRLDAKDIGRTLFELLEKKRQQYS